MNHEKHTGNNLFLFEMDCNRTRDIPYCKVVYMKKNTIRNLKVAGAIVVGIICLVLFMSGMNYITPQNPNPPDWIINIGLLFAIALYIYLEYVTIKTSRFLGLDEADKIDSFFTFLLANAGYAFMIALATGALIMMQCGAYSFYINTSWEGTEIWLLENGGYMVAGLLFAIFIIFKYALYTILLETKKKNEKKRKTK